MYNAGYGNGRNDIMSNETITLYLMADKASSTGLNEGIYVTLNRNKVTNAITWGNSAASTTCPQNSTFGAIVWLTSWT